MLADLCLKGFLFAIRYNGGADLAGLAAITIRIADSIGAFLQAGGQIASDAARELIVLRRVAALGIPYFALTMTSSLKSKRRIG